MVLDYSLDLLILLQSKSHRIPILFTVRDWLELEFKSKLSFQGNYYLLPLSLLSNGSLLFFLFIIIFVVLYLINNKMMM